MGASKTNKQQTDKKKTFQKQSKVRKGNWYIFFVAEGKQGGKKQGKHE